MNIMLALYTLKGERKHQSVIDAVPSGVAHVFVVGSCNLRAGCQGRRQRALAGRPPERSLDHGVDDPRGGRCSKSKSNCMLVLFIARFPLQFFLLLFFICLFLSFFFLFLGSVLT